MSQVVVSIGKKIQTIKKVENGEKLFERLELLEVKKKYSKFKNIIFLQILSKIFENYCLRKCGKISEIQEFFLTS